MRYKLGGALFVIILGATLLGGWLGDRVSAEGPVDDDEQVDALLRTFTDTIAQVQSHYAKEVDSADLVESAIRGMLRTLDPHSSYFAARDYRKLREEQAGEYYGLGILIRPERPGSGRVVVVEPPEVGTPGYKVGLRPGDVIAKIEGQAIDDWQYPDEILPRLKGPKGTSVRITVERPGEPAPMEFEVERAAIPLYTIKYAFFVRPGIGYIRIDKFSESTSDELDEALRKLDQSKLQGLVLDLRNNPGGSLNQAIQVSDRFLLKNQVIVSTKGRDGRDPRRYAAPQGRRYLYPMTILINRHSASASEIVSGALQDHDRALILGETSFGKALVQTVYPLRNNRGLALTTGKYYTPSNRLIQRPYAEGYYDYLYARSAPSQDLEKTYETDGGRHVFGGGGIKPDFEVEATRYTRFAARVNRGNLFQKFAGQLIRGEVRSDVNFVHDAGELRRLSEERRSRLMNRMVITEAGRTMDLFRAYLKRQSGLRMTDSDFEESRHQLANRLQQEITVALFGDREGLQIQLQIDGQVQKAIEMLPKAAALLEGQSQR